MANGSTLQAIRAAFEQAQGDGGVYDFTEHSAVAGISLIRQLHVTYRSGNEYLRLDTLLEGLAAVGTVQVFEFRGRGRNDAPQLMADIKVGSEVCQLIYLLPG